MDNLLDPANRNSDKIAVNETRDCHKMTNLYYQMANMTVCQQEIFSTLSDAAKYGLRQQILRVLSSTVKSE